MIVCTGEDCRARWGADGIGDIAVIEQHPVLGDAVEVGSVVDAVAVSRNCLGRMIIAWDQYLASLRDLRHDEDDIGA